MQQIPPAPGAIQYVTPQKTNGLGIASMVLGILGWIYLIPAILAVIFGHIAIKQIKREPVKYSGGGGMATAGLVLGYIWIGLFLVLVAVGASQSSY
jgi:predicted acyltransferase